MKVVIAGSRFIRGNGIINNAVEKSPWKDQITEVVSGAQYGVDALGEKWALDNGIAIRMFPANWKKYDKKAGPIRNAEMADYGDALIAIPDPEEKSSGTWCMVGQMRKTGKPFFIYKIQEDFSYNKVMINSWPFWYWNCVLKIL